MCVHWQGGGKSSDMVGETALPGVRPGSEAVRSSLGRASEHCKEEASLRPAQSSAASPVVAGAGGELTAPEARRWRADGPHAGSGVSQEQAGGWTLGWSGDLVEEAGAILIEGSSRRLIEEAVRRTLEGSRRIQEAAGRIPELLRSRCAWFHPCISGMCPPRRLWASEELGAHTAMQGNFRSHPL